MQLMKMAMGWMEAKVGPTIAARLLESAQGPVAMTET